MFKNKLVVLLLIIIIVMLGFMIIQNNEPHNNTVGGAENNVTVQEQTDDKKIKAGDYFEHNSVSELDGIKTGSEYSLHILDEELAFIKYITYSTSQNTQVVTKYVVENNQIILDYTFYDTMSYTETNEKDVFNILDNGDISLITGDSSLSLPYEKMDSKEYVLANVELSKEYLYDSITEIEGEEKGHNYSLVFKNDTKVNVKIISDNENLETEGEYSVENNIITIEYDNKIMELFILENDKLNIVGTNMSLRIIEN